MAFPFLGSSFLRTTNIVREKRNAVLFWLRLCCYAGQAIRQAIRLPSSRENKILQNEPPAQRFLRRFQSRRERKIFNAASLQGRQTLEFTMPLGFLARLLQNMLRGRFFGSIWRKPRRGHPKSGAKMPRMAMEVGLNATLHKSRKKTKRHWAKSLFHGDHAPKFRKAKP